MGKRWTEEEQILALNLYFKLPFGQQHSNNQKVQELAQFLGRTPGSINMKLNNYAALDPTLDREGLSNTSQKDEQIWNQFWQDLDKLGATSEHLYKHLNDHYQQSTFDRNEIETVLKKKRDEFGTEKQTQQTRRIGQQFFRRVVLSNYEYQCCVCRLKQKTLIEAAHIVEWSDTDDPQTRVDPQNGLALCSIHHKAFDKKIIRIEPEDKTVRLSEDIRNEKTQGAQALFHKFDQTTIHIPEKFGPHKKYLQAV